MNDVAGISAAVAKDQFLQLLVTQMRYQNPLDPMNNTEFVAQLAQLSALEQLENLNGKFEQVLKLQELSGGAALIGRYVVYYEPNTGLNGEGRVEAVQNTPDGLMVVVDGVTVPVDAIREVL